VTIENGTMTARQHRPLFTQTEYMFDIDGNCVGVIEQGDDRFDAGNPEIDCNGVPEAVEVRYDFENPDLQVVTAVPEDMQNQIQTLDMLYGREFGGRRYSSAWFAGFRYFAYEGHLPATAWLVYENFSPAGSGFTSGDFFPLLILHQESTGWGPTGTWEVDFNFKERGLQLFLLGQIAFTFNSLEVDSGPYAQVLANDVVAADRMIKSLDKSQWQNSFEVGGRVNFKNGLSIEAGYGIHGYLDILLTPDLLQIGIENVNPQSTTQDYVFDAFYAGASFQFGPGS
jgi:hypothetical protein